MSEYTPGPWTDGGWDNFDPESLQPVRVIEAPTRTIVAFSCTDASTWDEAHADTQCVANAHLIAAAPDLYEALDAALDHIRELEEAWQRGVISEHDGKGGSRSNRNVEMRVKAVAALAKARGELTHDLSQAQNVHRPTV